MIPKPSLEDPVTAPEVFFEAHQRLIEDLCGDQDWLETEAAALNHPAYQRWAYCKTLGARGIAHSNVEANALLAGTIILDSYALALCSGGAPNKFELGTFSNYGDARVRKRIRSTIKNPQNFISKISELTVAGWLLAQQFRVTASEADGEPDLFVDAKDRFEPYFIEVKSSPTSISDNALIYHLTTANTQLGRRAKDAKGLVLMDVAPRIAERMIQDALPIEIERIASTVTMRLKEACPNIRAAFVSWRDFALTPQRQSLRRVSEFAMRRRSIFIPNEDGREVLPDIQPLDGFGYTLIFEIDWRPRLPAVAQFGGGFPV